MLKGATVCSICGGPLDFDAPPRSRFAPSVDHQLPLKAMRGLPDAEQRRLALDRANLRPAHYGCNSARGARRPASTRKASRKW